MAELVVKYDTATKAMTVSLDGEELANVEEVSLCKQPTAYSPYQESPEDDTEGEEYCLRLCQREANEDGLTTVTHTMANVRADIAQYFKGEE
jgi:hypothetical protein